MSDKLCPVDWNTREFEIMMTAHLKKDEEEWKFYNDLILEWNAVLLLHGTRRKTLSEFLRFIISRVDLLPKPCMQ